MRHRSIITALVACNVATLLVVGASVSMGAAGGAAKQPGVAGAGKPGAAGASRPAPKGPPFLAAAAKFLGVKPDALRKQLGTTGTLTQAAAAAGKEVGDLKAAIIADETRAAAADVKAGAITQAQADARVAGVTAHIDDIVSKPLPAGGAGCRPGAGAGGAPAGGTTDTGGSGAGTTTTAPATGSYL
ncbi:MAG: hypothetical protein JWN72_416 [Thermoleophilia bacterium]|nr:hypothetical protein [Thermoleophilia bacterium]